MSAPVLQSVQTNGDAPSADVSVTFDDASATLALGGRVTIARAGEVEARLAALLGGHAGPITLDLSGVDRMDTVGAWLVHRVVRDNPGSTLKGADPAVARLVEEVAEADRACDVRPELEPFVTRELRKLGRYMFAFWHMILAVLGFVGTTLVAGWTALSSRRGVRWRAVTVQMEQAGVNALGIVGLMSFLIGIVLAQQGAVQLRQFGAEVFVINLVGRATFRELGILLTAIMIAGRSASAFAAQIGSMKLAEEVDAMRTIGLDPVEVLVLPRVIALTLMMPLLAFYASVLAVMGGGLFSWISLDIPPATYVQRLREVVPMSDFWIGLSKAPVFGAIIAIIGCFQGFQVKDSAESVGIHTTLAVVQAIFVVIVLDAFFAVFYSALGFN
jgi:phospholipid/cholesterol/gamma-HCH transport system permease protein